jgi:hypothetical protein
VRVFLASEGALWCKKQPARTVFFHAAYRIPDYHGQVLSGIMFRNVFNSMKLLSFFWQIVAQNPEFLARKDASSGKPNPHA